MKKMMFLSKNWYFSVQKVLIYYTVNKSHHNSFILLVFSHVANFRYVANFRFLTRLHPENDIILTPENTVTSNKIRMGVTIYILTAYKTGISVQVLYSTPSISSWPRPVI